MTVGQKLTVARSDMTVGQIKSVTVRDTLRQTDHSTTQLRCQNLE